MKKLRLSPSGAHRWINCAASAKLEAQYPDSTSKFAEEGTFAHELGDYCLSNGISNVTSAFVDDLVMKENDFIKEHAEEYLTDELISYVQEYVDYVNSIVDNTNLNNSNMCLYFTERKLILNNIVEETSGTADALILDFHSKKAHVIDLKFGMGVVVSAENNEQLMMYAAGVLDNFGDHFDEYVLHIVQPRTMPRNIVEAVVTRAEIIAFKDKAKVVAEIAKSDKAAFNPGEKQCKFCKAKADCKALADYTTEVLASSFDDLTNINVLSDEQKIKIIANTKLISEFISAVKEDVEKKMLDGKRYDGLKLVESTTRAKWTESAASFLEEKLGDEAYKKSLISITEAKKKFDKNTVKDIVSTYTTRPAGRPALALASDKRKPYQANVIEQFDIVEETLDDGEPIRDMTIDEIIAQFPNLDVH